MYEKQAKHFTKINQLDSAIKYFSIGKLVFVKLIFESSFLAHFMDPDDKNILSNLARNFLEIGDSKEAFRCAESVLKKVQSAFVIFLDAIASVGLHMSVSLSVFLSVILRGHYEQ